MTGSLTDFGKLFTLVSITFVLGVGLGLRMAADGTYIGPLTAVVSGGVVCITTTAIMEKTLIEPLLQ